MSGLVISKGKYHYNGAIKIDVWMIYIQNCKIYINITILIWTG